MKEIRQRIGEKPASVQEGNVQRIGGGDVQRIWGICSVGEESASVYTIGGLYFSATVYERVNESIRVAISVRLL